MNADNRDFHRTITVKAQPAETMEKISQVNLWWAKNFSGEAARLNDKFTVRFGDTYVAFQITEQVQGKKLTWKVTDCNLHWITDKKEWKGTHVVFELTPKGDHTQIDFTHIGLTPAIECYENCEEGWTGYLTGSLPKLIDEGNGMPE